ncbi:hypothetical protein ACSRUE_06025 [Sorangium sp. KYC3313]|uniref:hypothetical protein n=1 Tax=Sorangium sp. KYC3313 TaxID=3449740 RepID=UPI003F8B8842
MLISLSCALGAASCALSPGATWETDDDIEAWIAAMAGGVRASQQDLDDSESLEFLATPAATDVTPDAAPRGKCEDACMAYYEVIDRFCSQVPVKWKIRCHLAKASGNAACHARCP